MALLLANMFHMSHPGQKSSEWRIFKMCSCFLVEKANPPPPFSLSFIHILQEIGLKIIGMHIQMTSRKISCAFLLGAKTEYYEWFNKIWATVKIWVQFKCKRLNRNLNNILFFSVMCSYGINKNYFMHLPLTVFSDSYISPDVTIAFFYYIDLLHLDHMSVEIHDFHVLFKQIGSFVCFVLQLKCVLQLCSYYRLLSSFHLSSCLYQV